MEEHNHYIIPAIAILAPIAYTNIGRLFGIWESQWMYAILISIYIGIGAYIMHAYKSKPWGYFFTVIFLMPIGVLLDVVIDWNLRNFDRNLFPFEIMFLLAATPVLLLLGMGLSKLLGSNNTFKRDN